MCQQPASLKPLQVELAPAAASSGGLLLSLTFREGRLCKLQLLQTPLPEGVFSSSRPVDAHNTYSLIIVYYNPYTTLYNWVLGSRIIPYIP